MPRWCIITVLLLAGWLDAQNTTPTAALPTPPTSNLSTGEAALLASATDTNGNCVASAHVWCALHDPLNTGLLNGQRFIIKDSKGLPQWATAGGVACTGPAGAACNILNGTSPNGEVIVLDSMAQATAGYTGPGNWQLPFSSANGNCGGNNGTGGTVCGFIMPALPQFDPTNPKKLFIVTSHLSSFPAIGNLAIPNFDEVDGTGAYVPKSYVANVQPTDYARIYATGNNGETAFGIGGVPTGNIVFRGIEFTTFSTYTPYGTNGDGSKTMLGYTPQLVTNGGEGGSGARIMIIAIGTERSAMTQAGVIIGHQPFIVSCNLDTATGVPCSSVMLDPGTTPSTFGSAPTRRMYLFATPATTMVQGQTGLYFTFSGGEVQGTAYAPIIDGTNPAIQILPTACADSTTSVPPFICVTDAQHGYVDIKPYQPWTVSTCTSATKGCYNGGIYNFFLETFPSGPCPSAFPFGNYQPNQPYYQPGGEWSACTQHISNNDPLRVAYDHNMIPQFSIACATCPHLPDGTPLLPTNQTAYPITINGAPGQTAWQPTGTAIGIMWGFFAMELGTPTVTGTPGQTQTITGYSLTSNGFMTNPTPVTVNVRGAGASVTALGATTANDIGSIYRGLALINNKAYGMYYCGESQYVTHMWVRGNQYSFTCHGFGTHWTKLANCTTDPCQDLAPPNTNYLNFGSNIDVMSHVAVDDLTMNVTIFVCDGVTPHLGCTLGIAAERAADNIWFIQDWFHGTAGPSNLRHAADPTQTCKPASGNVVDTCFGKNIVGVQALLVMNGYHSVVRDSFFNDAIYPGNVIQDTQGIGLTFGLGGCLIENNFVGAGSENVFAGGVGNIASNSPVSPAGCVVHNNYMMHPQVYRAWGLGLTRPRWSAISSVCIGTVCNGGTGVANTVYITGQNNFIATTGGTCGTGFCANITGLTNPLLTFLNSAPGRPVAAAPTATAWHFALPASAPHADQPTITDNGQAFQFSGAAYNVIPPDNNYSAIISSKDNFELKAGSNWDVNGNIMDNQFTSPENPYAAIILTPRTAVGQGHSGASMNENVIRNNLAISQLEGIVIDPGDSFCNYGTAKGNGCNLGSFPLSSDRRLVVYNNLIVANQNENSPPAMLYTDPNFLPVPAKPGQGLRDMLFIHNTLWFADGVTTRSGGMLYNNVASCPVVTGHAHSYNLWILNNIFLNGFSASQGCSPTQWMQGPPAPNDLTHRAAGNIMTFGPNASNGGINSVNNANVTSQIVMPVFNSTIPPTYIMGNTFNNYQLTGSNPINLLNGYIAPATLTTDAATSGVDMAALLLAIGNTFTGQIGAITPTAGWMATHIGPGSLPFAVLNWTPSVSTTVTSQCVYRGISSANEDYTTPVVCFQDNTTKTYVDWQVQTGMSYYYTIVASDGTNFSVPSNEASAAIPLSRSARVTVSGIVVPPLQPRKP